MTHNNMPREIGTAWEVRVVRHAQEAGLPWDRAPLRGTADLLDVTGCQPAGFLIGCKAMRKPANPEGKLGPSMKEAEAAAARWLKLTGHEITPFQIIQRSGYPVGKAYAVTEYDELLHLILRLLRAEANHAG